ncbi:MAG: site-2 protease family protein [Nitrososphaeraceae archaeon]
MSIQVLKIKTIPIKVHFTLLFIFFLLTWTLSTGFMPHYYPNLSSQEYIIMGITGTIILFISILIHELAHSILSIRYGIKVNQIILFIFGGISDIKEETQDFKKEFNIAIVGPLSSFLLAGIFFGFFKLFSFLGNEMIQLHLEPLIGVLLYGFFVNILLGSFNLLPAFPMDGGRMLRAGLVRWLTYDKATRIAVQVGIFFSFILIGVGIILVITTPSIGGLWLILIGWFLHNGAKSYSKQFELSKLLTGVKLKDIMKTIVVSVKPDIDVKNLVTDYFNVYRKSSLPVIDDNSILVGMVTTDEVFGNKKDISQNKVMDIMLPRSNLIIMTPENEVNDALKELVLKRMNRIFVTDQNFKLTGIVSKTDILNLAQERSEFNEQRKSYKKKWFDLA